MTVRATPEAEFRQYNFTLPDGAPDVPLPYDARHIVPIALQIKMSRYPGKEECTAEARVFGHWKDRDGQTTKRLEDVTFPGGIHWTPDWVFQLIQSACPVGWRLSSR